MEIALTTHAINEFKRHLKESGSPIEVARKIARYFCINPHLVHATAYTVPRGPNPSRLRGPSTYLARISWKTSSVLLVLVFDRGNYSAVTTLSRREFVRGLKYKRITDVGEEPVQEKLLYRYGSEEIRVSPILESNLPFKPRRVAVEAGSALPLDGGVKCLWPSRA